MMSYTPLAPRSASFKYLRTMLLRVGAATLLAGLTVSCAHNGGGANESAAANPEKAKNVILFVGDGMGVSTVTAIRILAGQLQGQSGEEYVLSWEEFPHVALSKTYNTNQQVPDSAGTATAMLSGVKTKAGFIGVGPAPKRTDCVASLLHPVESILERAERKGLSTGIATTARLTHATPASAYAHAPERDWESVADMPDAAISAGCKDIAQQLIEFPIGNGLEVALGGGRSNFLPNTAQDPEYSDRKGNRTDGRDLSNEWANRQSASYVWNEHQFQSVDVSETDHLLGLFDTGHMKFSLHREDDPAGEPSLAEMTEKAIKILQKNEKGFFLLVEGGRIDHGHHEGVAALALHDGVAMAEAVTVADQMTSDADTLIIVTADHSHTFVMAGYPTRGNPILGKVIGNDDFGEARATPDLLADNLPYTTLGYYNGPGAITSLPRPDISEIDTEAPTYRQQALIPRSSETHGGEDVAIYAKGPGSKRIHGVMEQSSIYDVMLQAYGFDKE